MKHARHALNTHHRLPTSIGGGNEESNISMLPAHQHDAWHSIVSNHTASTICFLINDKFLDPNYKLICVPTDKYDKVNALIKQVN